METIPIPKYGDKITAGYAPGESGVAVYDPNTGKPLAGAGAFNPNTGAPIKATDLKPVSSYTIPEVKNTPTTDTLSIANNTAQGQIQSDLTTPPPTTQVTSDKTGLRNMLGDLFGKVSNQSAEEQKIIQEQQVNEKRQKAQAVSNELDVLDKSFRDRIKELRSTFTGTTAGLSNVLAKEQDQYENTRANIALTYKVLSQDYQGAQDIVNQKISSLERQNAQQFQIYNAAKDLIYNDLTDREKRILDDQSTLKIQKAKQIEGTYSSILNNAIQNNAPASVLSAIDAASRDPNATPATIAIAAGRYGINKEQDLANQKLQMEINDLMGAGNNNALSDGQLIDPKKVQAINTILGSGKFTKDQAKAIRNAINTGEDPITVIKNQAKALMTGANQTKVESYETAQFALNNLEENLKKYYASGGKTNIFKGNYEKTINKLGEVSNPNLVELATQIQQNLQIYRNAVSGTAYSVQEGADIASIFPGITKSQGLNNAIIKGRRQAFIDGIDGAYTGVLGNVYKQFKTDTNKVKSTEADESLLKSFGL